MSRQVRQAILSGMILFLLGACSSSTMDEHSNDTLPVKRPSKTQIQTQTKTPEIKTTRLEENIQTATSSTTPFENTISLHDPYQSSDKILQLEQHLQNLGFREIGIVDGAFDEQTTLAVQHLQWLNSMSITGAADVYFGTKTNEAVRHFQEVNQLFADGIVGEITWDVLFFIDAKSL
ncbi:MAG: peptidoglycan-binding domain-containing protein [Chloroflexota bacterium]|nr:peptidoglycan-binding domain-containing protein [Chloroflexota bacterium]